VLSGVVPIVPTPFHADGSLDGASLRRVVDYLVAAGVHGLAVLGVASEVWALTDAERRAVVEAAVGEARGRLPVVAGCSYASGQAAAAAARELADAGADALMVMPPHFVKPTAATLLQYYELVAAAVDVPLMIQDNPGWTGVEIPVDAYRELAGVGGIEYAKVEVPHPPTKIRAVRAAVPDGVTLLGGLAGNWLLEELAAGSRGTMPASLMPQIYVQVWDLWQSGDHAAARSLFDRYHPAIRVTAQPTAGFAMVKHLLWRIGVLEAPAVRNPLNQLTAADQADLEAVVDGLGLLELMRP
jgi:4-hydroxy-tetrahydrodipicolinate synthase